MPYKDSYKKCMPKGENASATHKIFFSLHGAHGQLSNFTFISNLMISKIFYAFAGWDCLDFLWFALLRNYPTSVQPGNSKKGILTFPSFAFYSICIFSLP